MSHFGGLVWTLVRTDFKSRYHWTIGGFFWALLKPLAMFLVLMSVFSFVFSADPQYKINLIIGLFLFDFFSESTKVGLMSLYSKGYLLSKAKFPSWIIVVSSSSNAVITLSIFMVAIALFSLVGGRQIGIDGAALLLFYLLSYLLMVTGISLATSVLFLRYRDLNQVWDVLIQAGLFLAPIIYPLKVIPERFHFYMYMWPPTPIIQFTRAVLVDGVTPTPKAHGLLVLEAIVILFVGLIVYQRLGPRAAEYL